LIFQSRRKDVKGIRNAYVGSFVGIHLCLGEIAQPVLSEARNLLRSSKRLLSLSYGFSPLTLTQREKD